MRRFRFDLLRFAFEIRLRRFGTGFLGGRCLLRGRRGLVLIRGLRGLRRLLARGKDFFFVRLTRFTFFAGLRFFI